MECGQNQKVHVVIVNWNGARDTEDCLDSLYSYERESIIVSVIDNSADHAPCKALCEKFRDTNFVFSERNLGFAKACNIGLEWSSKLGVKYTLFLNNDTVVIRPFIQDLKRYLDTQVNVAAVSPFVNYFDDPEEPWFHSSKIDMVGMHIVHTQACNIAEPHLVPWLSGCAFFARTELLVDCAGFDGDFFLYSEDVDLSLKLRNMGYDLGVVPIVSVLHKVGKSTSTVSRLSTYYAVRNRIIILKRYFHVNMLKFSVQLLRESFSTVLHTTNSVEYKVSFFFIICSAIWSGLNWRK